MPNESPQTYSGFIALIGRPNVGKSTLLNHLIGQKISITANKPQTTRHRIVGVKTIDNRQLIFVDTPGLHQHFHSHLNQQMNRVALTAIHDVDVIVWVVEAKQWNEDDEWILHQLQKVKAPIILAINKIDQLTEQDDLNAFMATITAQLNCVQVIPIAARYGTYLDSLQAAIAMHLAPGPFYYLPEQITDRDQKFRLAEVLREKLTRTLGQEVPHALIVTIEKCELVQTKKQVYHVHAVIWVEREGQKKIVIGEKGQMLKKIGELARTDMEALLKQKVFLKTWVKVKSNWRDDVQWLESVGH